MKAVVLAAGIGSRLGKLTKTTPKCLLPVQGRPLLDYWLENLAACGVNEVFINLHHLHEQVEQFLSSRQCGISFETSYEPVLLGSAGTLREAKSFIGSDSEFLIVYADNFAPKIDLSRLIRFHREQGGPVLTLVAYPTDKPRECGIIELDHDGRVISFEEKPAHPKTNLANSGIHAANPALFGCIPDKTPADIGFDVLPVLIQNMYGYVTNETIMDVGTPETYRAVQEISLEYT